MGFKVQDRKNGQVDIKIVKGDSFSQKIKIYTEDLLLYIPSENDVITFQIWNKYTDSTPLFEKEIDYQDMTFTLSAEESAAFKYGNYVYSVKIEFENGTVDHFLSGTVAIVVPGGDL